MILTGVVMVELYKLNLLVNGKKCNQMPECSEGDCGGSVF